VVTVDEAEAALAEAGAAFAEWDAERAVAHLSSAVRAFTALGDQRRAAMACAQLGDAMANGLGNLVAARAWFVRARRLVADLEPCVEQGWVSLAAMGCDVDDPDVLRAAAELALDRARRFGDVNLETKALADGGLALVELGRLDEGMAMLDEAMALACGPADDPGTSAKSVCSFFTACYYAADFERADSWSDLFRRHGLIGTTSGHPVFVSAHCDSVQARLLVELGRWSDAEAVLERARRDFEAAMRGPSWHPDINLADLRIRQGRLAEAEALLLGKDHAIEALLPAARLHHARGDHGLARAAARRGLRAIGGDRLRSVALLTLLVDVELASGDLAAAEAACAELDAGRGGVGVVTLRARAAAARARVLAASGQGARAVDLLEATVGELDPRRLPYLRASVLAQLACAREALGDAAGAAADARAALHELDGLDAVLGPAEAAVVERLSRSGVRLEAPVASLVRQGKRWVVLAGGVRASLPDTKGLRYVAELVATPGRERHALDLVDRVEGVDVAGGIDRRRLGDLGPALDASARSAYRRRIEELRVEADDALAAGHLDEAERVQAELDQLVGALAQAFGLGGRARPGGSAAERARLNVTRALRAAIERIEEAAPDAGAALDRRTRTGLYCCYEPVEGEVRWIVQT